MAQEARMAAGAAKSKGAESFPICPLFKNIFALHPRFPHLFGGGVLVFPYQIENSRPVLRQYRFAGRSAFPIPQGGCTLQKNYRFPGAEWMAYSFIV